MNQEATDIVQQLRSDIAPRVHHLVQEAAALEIERLRETILTLERQVYVPGCWKCDKCKLVIVSHTLHAASGHVRTNNKIPEGCMNGCGPMRRKTEREAGNELVDRLSKVVETLKVADLMAETVENLGDYWTYNRAKGKDAILTDEDDQTITTLTSEVQRAIKAYRERRPR